MKDRRTFLTTAALAALPLAAGRATAAAREATGHYQRFLDVIRAWKVHDIDGVLAGLTDDVVWYAFVGAPPFVGKTAMRKRLEELAVGRFKEDWRIFHHAVNGSRLFVEGVDAFTDGEGRYIAVPYAGVIEFRGDLVSGWRDYFDLGTMQKMKAGEPVPAAIEPLVSRKGEP